MFGEKYIQVVLLLLIHSLTIILLFFKTHGLLFKLELVLFLFMFVISIIYLFGLFFEEGWAWALIMLFYGVSLFNLLFLMQYMGGSPALFAIAFIVDFIGFFQAIANIGENEEDLEIEPYESEVKKEKEAEDSQVEIIKIDLPEGQKDIKSPEEVRVTTYPPAKKTAKKRKAKKKTVKKKSAKKKTEKKKSSSRKTSKRSRK